MRVIWTRMRVILTRYVFWHYFGTNECDNDTLECDFNAQSVIYTLIVILTRTNVISKRKIIHTRVEFQHRRDFNTSQLKWT
jgi:hypothetical protein